MINKLKFMLLFVATIGMVSCSDDDGGGQTTSGDIVGTWEMSAFSFEGSTTYEFDGETHTEDYYGVGKEMNDVLLTFNEDGTVTTNGKTFTVEMTWESEGEEITEEYPTETIINAGTWEKNGNTLILTEPDGNITELNIEKLNNTTLHITGDIEESSTGINGMMSVDMQFTKMGSPTTGAGDPSGTWEVTDLEYSGTSTTSSGGQTFTTQYDAVAIDFGNTTVTFNSDGTFDSAGNGITVDATITFMGQTTSQQMSAPGFVNEGTWSINGDIMTLTNNGADPIDCEIVTLNATTLHLKGTTNVDMMGSSSSVDFDMTLTKQ